MEIDAVVTDSGGAKDAKTNATATDAKTDATAIGGEASA